MAEIVEINISGSNVALVNKGWTNAVTVVVDLSKVWVKVNGYTNLYMKVALTIPIIEGTIPKSIAINLEETYKVDRIDPLNPSIILMGECPGKIDTSGERVASGIASILFYNIIPV